MKVVIEYLRNAEECRKAAAAAASNHRELLMRMADQWEALASSRGALLDLKAPLPRT